MKIALDTLRTKITATLKQKGFSDGDSTRIADYIVWAEMSGNKTQGLVKMTGTEPIQSIVPRYEPKVERETQLSQLIDGGANPAPVVASLGADVAIQKAQQHGFAIVGVRNTFSSNGAQAYYAEYIAQRDLIGFVCSRSPACVAGFGSTEPIFGTNPLSYAFPTEDEPIVFDMATSSMTFYGLVLAKARGEQIAEHVAIDSAGNATTDPRAAMSGALLPFDHSYKGSGLALMVEMLAGPLIGGAWVDNKTLKEEWGSVFIAIDPNLLIDTADFKTHASQLLQDIESARTITSIRLPGERAKAQRKAAQVSGYVEVDDVIMTQLGYDGIIM